MYRIEIDTSTDRHFDHTAPTGDDAIAVLHQHLTKHLADGSVAWTITSPYSAEHLGRITLNGNTPDQSALFIHHCLYGAHSVQASLAHEAYQRQQLSDPSCSLTPSTATADTEDADEPAG